jgi:hypothetical protein
MLRVVHVITSACDVYVARESANHVRVRIYETDPELTNPTEVEIEGDPEHIAEALMTVAAVLSDIEAIGQKEPN